METQSGGETKLAAIMFTDIAGYSRLMEEDEQRTIRLLETHNAIVLPLIEAAGGEVIDAIGDGLFVLFPSVRDTVTCASSVCDAIAAHNDSVGAGEQLHLRIGIHLGEIWRRDSRVYGNGVNVAARVQPFAAPCGICVTEDVYRQIANRPELKTEHIGRHELHNISRPFDLYSVITGHEVRDAHNGEEESGELDAVKERILREKERLSDKRHRNRESDETESRIESKIYKLVDHAMDKALEKWDELPPEKKKEAITALSDANESKKKSVKVSLEKNKKSDSDSGLIPGIVMTTGFGLGYFAFGLGWMIWPLLIVGVLPLTGGLIKTIRNAVKRRRRRLERPEVLQKYMLSLAGENNGTLTVVQAASDGEITLREAQETLDRMAAHGYVVQQVTDEGLIEYQFPGMLPSREHTKET